MKIIFLTIISSLVLSCGPVPLSKLGHGPAVRMTLMNKESFDSSNFSASRSITYLTPVNRAVALDIEGDNYFKDEMKENSRGELLRKITPSEFVINLQKITLYNANDTNYGVHNKTTPIWHGEYHIVPLIGTELYSMVNTRSFIRDAEVTDYYWKGLNIEFFNGVERSGVNSQGLFYASGSIVAIDLGEEYRDINMRQGILLDMTGASTETWKEGTIHYFSLDSVSPFATAPSSILMGQEITEYSIHNPYGLDDYEGSQNNPGGNSEGNLSMLLVPGQGFDLSQYLDPEYILIWDMEDLIEIYSGQTAALADDVITLRLDNPYPVDLAVTESSNITPETDNIPPGEVFWVNNNDWGRAYSGSVDFHPNVNLGWVNPSDPDFDLVRIIKKEGSPPADKNDGELVWEHYNTSYFEEVPSNSNPYYLIYTVDTSGNESDGVIVEPVLNAWYE